MKQLFLASALVFGILLMCSTAVSAADQHQPATINHVVTNGKVIALTFDADMTYGMRNELRRGQVSSWYNSDVVTVLEHTKTPATFFLTGLWAETYPDVVKQLSTQPLFEFGNHSYSHPGFTPNCYHLPTVKATNKTLEITRAAKVLAGYPATRPYFRFPGLCAAPGDVRLAQQLGYTVIGGSLTGTDAFNPNAKTVVSHILRRVKPGDIITLHLNGGPNAPATAIALAELIPTLTKLGYRFVTVSQLLALGQPTT